MVNPLDPNDDNLRAPFPPDAPEPTRPVVNADNPVDATRDGFPRSRPERDPTATPSVHGNAPPQPETNLPGNRPDFPISPPGAAVSPDHVAAAHAGEAPAGQPPALPFKKGDKVRLLEPYWDGVRIHERDAVVAWPHDEAPPSSLAVSVSSYPNP